MHQRSRGAGTTLFTLLLILMFIISCFTLLLVGIRLYGKTSMHGNDGFNERTALSYITARIRRSDYQGIIKIVDFEGVSALAIQEEQEGLSYVTMIYAWDGQLRELLYRKGLSMSPEDGMPIIPVESLEFQKQENGLLEVHCKTKSGSTSMQMLLKSAGGGAV